MKPTAPALDAMRRDARRIFAAALAAADPEEAVRRAIRREGAVLRLDQKDYNLGEYERLLVVGAGKAAAPMARALEGILGGRIDDGMIVVKDGHGLPLKRIRLVEAGHPLPDRRGVAATEELLGLAGSAGERDLLICLITGGGSALLVAPAEGIGLADKQSATRLLLGSGATIHEFNTVRKHLSRVKGGRLAQAAFPAEVLTLILSDVVGDDLDVIASGPTAADASTFADAIAILKRRRVWKDAPASVRGHLERGAAGEIPETPKPADPLFARVAHRLVASNLRSLRAAAAAAEEAGYRPLILTSALEGEAREAARGFAAIAKEIRSSAHPLAPPACILAGGETTVTLKGTGRGGRSQEFALSGAIALEGLEGVVLLAAGTDGTDGTTEAAGALADGETAVRAAEHGIDLRDHLERNDAYNAFRPLGDLVVTGPTRTNVMDVYLILVAAAGPASARGPQP
jgi:hydroxypyruvate reductase